MYAIIRTGGKQYRVSDGTVLAVEKLAAEEGATIELTDVLMLADGDNLTVGTPLVAGAKVTATVVSTSKGVYELKFFNVVNDEADEDDD